MLPDLLSDHDQAILLLFDQLVDHHVGQRAVWSQRVDLSDLSAACVTAGVKLGFEAEEVDDESADYVTADRVLVLLCKMLIAFRRENEDELIGVLVLVRSGED